MDQHEEGGCRKIEQTPESISKHPVEGPTLPNTYNVLRLSCLDNPLQNTKRKANLVPPYKMSPRRSSFEENNDHPREASTSKSS